ncbi:hypothetical protein DSUL_20460 [Desulfovibrionales bacterium]
MGCPLDLADRFVEQSFFRAGVYCLSFSENRDFIMFTWIDGLWIWPTTYKQLLHGLIHPFKTAPIWTIYFYLSDYYGSPGSISA